jgi:hypothetical protein
MREYAFLTFLTFGGMLGLTVNGGRSMFESLDIRHWLVIAVLILINVVIFGCIILLLTNRVVLPI